MSAPPPPAGAWEWDQARGQWVWVPAVQPAPAAPRPVVPTPASSPARGGSIAALVIVVLVVVTVGVVAAGPLGITDCTVGVAGSNATIEYQGLLAFSACSTQLQVASYYRVSGQPAGTLICRYSWGGVTRTVRDVGLLNLVGTAICAQLQTEYDQAQAGHT